MSLNVISDFKSRINSINDKQKSLIIALILVVPVFYIYLLALNSTDNKVTYILNDTLLAFIMFFIASLSLDLEVGSLGLPNFGKVAFIAIGAYITTIVMNFGLFGNFFIDFMFGLVVGCAISAFFGWLIAIPSVKLRADYFAIMTIAAGEIVRLVLQNEKRYFWTLTDAAHGIKEPLVSNSFRQNVAAVELFGVKFSTFVSMNFGVYNLGIGNSVFFTLDLNFGQTFLWQIIVFIFFLIVALICYAFVQIIRKSPYGRTLRAIREDDITVTSVGKDVYAYRWQITVIAAIICSIAGSLFSILNSSFEPLNFLPEMTFLLFVFIIIGGIGNSKGVAFGALIIQMFTVASTSQVIKEQMNFSLGTLIPQLNQLFQDFSLRLSITADFTRWIVLGTILLIFLLFRPEGIIPEPKSNNENYLNLLTKEERADSDSAVNQMQSSSEKERLGSEPDNNSNEV